MSEGFAIDPDVMARIRPMHPADAPAVAHLHHADMGRSLWARLGLGFLEAIYGALVGSRFFLGFVYEEEGRVAGFIAGTTNGPRMFGDIFARHGLRLAWRALWGIVRAPALLLPLLATPLYFGRSRAVDGGATNDGRISAESLFCSFVPHLRGKRVSGHVNKVLFDELAWRGHAHVKITTEVDNEGSNRQLTRWGFRPTRRFHFYGKPMIVYVLDLRSSPRVEAVRHFDGAPW